MRYYRARMALCHRVSLGRLELRFIQAHDARTRFHGEFPRGYSYQKRELSFLSPPSIVLFSSPPYSGDTIRGIIGSRYSNWTCSTEERGGREKREKSARPFFTRRTSGTGFSELGRGVENLFPPGPSWPSLTGLTGFHASLQCSVIARDRVRQRNLRVDSIDRLVVVIIHFDTVINSLGRADHFSLAPNNGSTCKFSRVQPLKSFYSKNRNN